MAPSTQTHTKLSSLVIKFLKAIDSYNENDLSVSDTDTDQDTLGERARIVLNLALSNIYGMIKDSKYLDAMPTTALVSTADQDFIQLDIVPQIDDVEKVLDTENDYRLERKSWAWYRRNYPDPASSTGRPLIYIIRNDRMYLAPRPTEAVTYTVDYRKLTDDLELPGDLPLLPTQYDAWIISEAKVWWYGMEDPTSVPPILVSERNQIREISLGAINVSFDHPRQSASHFGASGEARNLGYSRPVGG